MDIPENLVGVVGTALLDANVIDTMFGMIPTIFHQKPMPMSSPPSIKNSSKKPERRGRGCWGLVNPPKCFFPLFVVYGFSLLAPKIMKCSPKIRVLKLFNLRNERDKHPMLEEVKREAFCVVCFGSCRKENVCAVLTLSHFIVYFIICIQL